MSRRNWVNEAGQALNAAGMNGIEDDLELALGVPDQALKDRINTAGGLARLALEAIFQRSSRLDQDVATNVTTNGTSTRTALDGLYGSQNPLGTASNPVTSATAARPSGITSVWWLTPTQPTNWSAGDVWVVTP